VFVYLLVGYAILETTVPRITTLSTISPSTSTFKPQRVARRDHVTAQFSGPGSGSGSGLGLDSSLG
jgi:hypothetical protein